MRGGPGCFAGGNELFYQIDIGLINHLRIVVAVHGSEVNDNIALAHEFLKNTFVLKVFILEWDTNKFIGV
jgi:hypothetical protein